MRKIKQRILIELEAGPMKLFELVDRLPWHKDRTLEIADELIDDGRVAREGNDWAEMIMLR